MSSKYAIHFKIPEGLDKLTKDFAREVLRKQPINIYQFGAEYFDGLLKKLNTSPNVAIVESLEKVFEGQDKDSSGLLTYADFKKILKDENNQITPRGAIMALLECEINDSGQISYVDFLKNAVLVLDNAAATGPLEISDETPRVHIHGMTREDFVNSLASKFGENDVKGEFGLERNLLRIAFRDRELGLTRREVNCCMGFLEENHGDGQFDYSVLSNSLWELLITAHEQNFLSLPVNKVAVTQGLMERFQEMDEEKKGELPPTAIQAVLYQAELGFTALQINAILGLLANLASDVNYQQFTDYIADWVVQLLLGRDLHDPSPQIANMQRDELTEYLLKEFMKFDPSSSGFIKYDDLNNVISALNFTPREKSAILSFIIGNVHDENGVPYETLATSAYDVCWQQQRLGLDNLG